MKPLTISAVFPTKQHAFWRLLATIENSFHWVLDVTFREDDSRIRLGDSPQNMAILRHIALNILKRDPSKASLKQKRFRAGLDEPFLLNLLTNI